ncbi:MAG: N-acyl homoserine lactonase family protein [Pseudomonadota bacterium]
MSDIWEVYALRYAERNTRTRQDSFLLDDDHASPHPMDYFVWALRNGTRTIVVDTGYDEAEGRRRGRPILRDPATQLGAFGTDPATVDTVIITHLHYDHAGSLDRFLAARFHLQADEMAYATGPCMCHGHLRAPFTADHVSEMLRKIYSGRVVFHDGTAEIAPGVLVEPIGGHSRGLQSVRVKTRVGWLCLASDAAHYYENFLRAKPFPIVVDMEAMLQGFRTIRGLAARPEHVIPGHDPLIRQLFPAAEGGEDVWRLDVDPTARLNAKGSLA